MDYSLKLFLQDLLEMQKQFPGCELNIKCIDNNEKIEFSFTYKNENTNNSYDQRMEFSENELSISGSMVELLINQSAEKFRECNHITNK